MHAQSSSRRPTPPGLFIAGTDTGVGKTWIAAAIARACRARGVRVAVYKPVASGVDPAKRDEQDAWQLWQAAGQPKSLGEVCPQVFTAPLAPHLAARKEGGKVDEDLLVSGLQVWNDFDLVIVEGIGGLMSPAAEDIYTADLASDFGYPVIVVTANRLGVINQTLQTLITAAAFRNGLDVVGVVLNDTRENDSDESMASNPAELRERCGAPLLAHCHWQDATPIASIDWMQLAGPLHEEDEEADPGDNPIDDAANGK